MSETVVVYAPAASDAFNEELGRRLAELARDVRDAVGRPFVALLLGGGYGRGEGAVTRAGGREAPCPLQRPRPLPRRRPPGPRSPGRPRRPPPPLGGRAGRARGRTVRAVARRGEARGLDGTEYATW